MRCTARLPTLGTDTKRRWVIDRDVNAVNQVTQVVTDVRLPDVHTTTESLTYDARGNRTGSVTTRTTGNKTHDLARVEYTFDGMGQLVGVWDHGDNLNNPKDDAVTQWSRDGLGRGLSVSDNGVTRDRVFDGTALIVDGDTRVTFGPDGRVLSEAFETVEGHGKNATEVTVLRDVLTDLLGSAVGVAEDGIVNADLTWFGDFGDTLSEPEWDTVTSFTGHVETAGLVEFATRTYDPATRVWVQEDSFTGTVTRASSLNRYAYVEGSPVSHTDVLGAYRAAAAMAAQKLSAVDYAQFILRLKIFSAIGVHNEQAANSYLASEGGGGSGSADTRSSLEMVEDYYAGGGPGSGQQPNERDYSALGQMNWGATSGASWSSGWNWYWDRESTWLQYQGQANWRRAKNWRQTVWDGVTLNVLAEDAVATYQILVKDAELLNDGACGSEASCFTGAWGPSIQGGENDGKHAAITIGHTVSIPDDVFISPKLIDHEIDGHVKQYEFFGGEGFARVYLGDYVIRRYAFGDDNAYYNNVLEQEARQHGDP